MSTIATIDVVAGDNLPNVTLTLTDQSNGAPIDVSAATVTVYFQTVGATPNADGTPAGTPITCTNVTTGVDGAVTFFFPNGCTNVDPGLYDGKIVLMMPGSLRYSVFDTLRFRVRAA